MHCVLVAQTSCCTNNCSKAEEPSHPEYQVDNSDEETDEEQEEIDKLSVKTFPFEHRP